MNGRGLSFAFIASAAAIACSSTPSNVDGKAPQLPGAPLVALFDDGVLYGVGADGRVFSGADLRKEEPALNGARSIAGYAGGWVILGSAPDGYECAAHPNGEVDCMGSNEKGDLDPIVATSCDNPNNACPPPTKEDPYCFRLFGPTSYSCVRAWTPVPGVRDLVQLHGTCGVSARGKLVCWGRSSGNAQPPRPVAKLAGGFAILDDGTLFDRNAAALVAGIANVIEAAGSADTTACAVKDDATLWCWGHNLFALVGDGTTTDRTAPVKVGEGFASVRFGLGMACGAMKDGGVSCWGVSGVGADAGAPGITCSSETCVATPTRVARIADVVQVVPNTVDDVLVLTRDGRVLKLANVFTTVEETVVHPVGP